MNKINKQDIAKAVTKYYASVSSMRPTNYAEDNLTRLCKNALENVDLQAKWELFKNNASSYFVDYKSLTFDTELINNVPSFRYGLEIINDKNRLVNYSFYISLMLPFFSWYFIDREKYPKDKLTEKLNLGPTRDKFYKFGLEIEYDKLNRGEIQSIVDIDLPQSTLVDFLSSSPRFYCTSDEEKDICKFLSQQASQIFSGYEYLDNDIGSLDAVDLVPKSVYAPKYYTYFDCLFISDLTYL